MHLFISGDVGVGKTTLIHQLLKQIPDEKIHGFYTQKESPEGKFGDSGGIYMFSAKKQLQQPVKRCVAEILGSGKFDLHLEVFEEYGVSLLEDIPDGSIVVMDELGFLESQAATFCDKVLEILGRDVIVLGVIKPKHTDFLEKVRNHPLVQLHTITEENRVELTKRLEEQLVQEVKTKKME